MRIIATDAAPKAIGPYSQAIALDGFVFTAGQVALDPKSGDLVGRTTAEQTEQVITNLQAVLSAAGATLASVVKTTVYLADMADFAQMNEVYASHCGAHNPAGSTGRAGGCPKGARVEIDVFAVPHYRGQSGEGFGSGGRPSLKNFLGPERGWVVSIPTRPRHRRWLTFVS